MKPKFQPSWLVRRLTEDETDDKDEILVGGLAVGHVEEFEWDDRGMTNSSFFSGASSYDFDAVFVGAGDNPAEAADDALDQAGGTGWNVEEIVKDGQGGGQPWPGEPSCSSEIRDQIKDELDLEEIALAVKDEIDPDREMSDAELDAAMEAELPAAIDAAIDKAMENLDSELYYYMVLRLKGNEPKD